MTQHRTALEQPNYFPGQLLTATGLNRNLANEWERRWTHNRALHGSGIVTGLTLDYEVGAVTVTVEPGHAIDPLGRELILVEPRTLQVPPLPGSTASDGTVTPDQVVLVIRWDETPASVVSAGTCDTEGASAFLETPVIEFVTEGAYPSQKDVVALATVDVAACVIHDVDFARRRVLGERPLPYVDAGVFAPAALDWQIVTSGPPADRGLGLTAMIDTSVAGFSSTPHYQARLSGSRYGDIQMVSGLYPFIMWAPDVNVSQVSSTGFRAEIPVPLVQAMYTGGSEGAPGWSWLSLDQFVDDVDGGEATVLSKLADDLGWAITWVGVEGAL